MSNCERKYLRHKNGLPNERQLGRKNQRINRVVTHLIKQKKDSYALSVCIVGCNGSHASIHFYPNITAIGCGVGRRGSLMDNTCFTYHPNSNIMFAGIQNGRVVQKGEQPWAVLITVAYYLEWDYDIGCSIVCAGDKDVNIAPIFADLKPKLPANVEPFTRFKLNSSAISELPANVFSGVPFAKMHIQNAYALKRVHRLAFNGTERTVQVINFSNSPVSEVVVGDWDLFGKI
ncbi:unnamed protein product [Medioppia subpectinata]|uniref:Uncharacterized protein n=1 Tax=Medioppia subpectinata TaxID=1979941 RepID=A0A7R9KQN1_9ACAR|nr:unnamed protein product [Medioppia subpectinata]CAG2106891.1 unnamed protein product [Medioppia subpectinata]